MTMNSERRLSYGSPRVMRIGVIAAIVMLALSVWMHTGAASTESGQPQRLAVLWTSGDPEVAHRVAFMYTEAVASQQWFDEVQLIVWGPSARLLAGDKDVQEALGRLKVSGVAVKACVVCADSYGVTDQLRDLDLEVKGMGRPLTDLLQDESWTVLTF